MIERHGIELEKFIEVLNKNLPEAPKDSSELLNLRKIEQNLVREKEYFLYNLLPTARYLEAHKV